MFRKVTIVLEATQQVPARNRPLRVAACCRVSAMYEGQQQSLATQISYYTNCIQNHPNWVLVAVYSDTVFGSRTNP